MTEKRFVRKGYKIWDTWEDEEVYELHYRYEVDDICDEWNELSEENEQLKQELKTIGIVNKQYEENQRLIKMLDNVANYMQKQHKDMPIDDFVEWWNNIVTEGLDD